MNNTNKREAVAHLITHARNEQRANARIQEQASRVSESLDLLERALLARDIASARQHLTAASRNFTTVSGAIARNGVEAAEEIKQLEVAYLAL